MSHDKSGWGGWRGSNLATCRLYVALATGRSAGSALALIAKRRANRDDMKGIPMSITPAVGQRPHALASALFALAMFTMLSAVVFLSPFALSPYAQQNDVYMGNLFIAPLIFLLGSFIFLVALALLGLHTILAGLLALISLLAAGSFALSASGLPYSIYTYAVLGDVILLLVVGYVVAEKGSLLALWSRGTLLALLGAGVLIVLYILFGGHYTSFGDTPIGWPPYLTASILGVTAGLAGVTFLIGWLCARRPIR